MKYFEEFNYKLELCCKIYIYYISMQKFGWLLYIEFMRLLMPVEGVETRRKIVKRCWLCWKRGKKATKSYIIITAKEIKGGWLKTHCNEYEPTPFIVFSLYCRVRSCFCLYPLNGQDRVLLFALSRSFFAYKNLLTAQIRRFRWRLS